MVAHFLNSSIQIICAVQGVIHIQNGGGQHSGGAGVATGVAAVGINAVELLGGGGAALLFGSFVEVVAVINRCPVWQAAVFKLAKQPLVVLFVKVAL